MTRAHIFVAHAMACLALVFAFPGLSGAQTVEIEPTHLTVTRGDDDPAVLRCFAGRVWYPVAELARGRVLLADATRDGFYRVRYPGGVPTVVQSENARPNTDRGTVTLTDATPLRARNLRRPTTVDSYKDVLDKALPAGTELPMAGEIREDGEIAGYLVIPPERARAWVNARHVRESTPEEIARLAQTGGTDRPAADAPDEEVPAGEQAQTPTPAPAESRAQEQAQTEEPDPAPRTEPGTEADGAPAPDKAAEPDEPEPAEGAQPAKTATEDEQRDEPEPDADPALGILRELAQLDDAYESIRAQRLENAEIAPLLAEYRSLRGRASELSEDNEQMRNAAQYAEARIGLLELRAEVQRARAELARLEARTDETARAIREARRDLMRARGYAVVGILTRSSLYTGDELPLRYRLQSAAGGVARTLAYIEVDPETNIEPLLGAEVGVIPREGGVMRAGPVPVIEADVVERMPDSADD